MTEQLPENASARDRMHRLAREAAAHQERTVQEVLADLGDIATTAATQRDEHLAELRALPPVDPDELGPLYPGR